MLGRDKTKLVDGLVTLRATQLHKREKRYSTKSSDEEQAEKAPESSKPAVRKTGSGIGRTVMPTQNQIVCYACNFQFVMRGRAESTQCPKCGARLSLKDQTITGGFSEELVTAGKVTLTKSAILDGGHLIANDIVLEGTVKAGTLKAFQTLELAKGAVIPEELIDAKHLRIGVGGSFDFHTDMQFEDVDIQGELKADITANGMVAVRSTGHLLGSLTTTHFMLEEGGGLNASVHIAPPAPDPIEEDEANGEAPAGGDAPGAEAGKEEENPAPS